MFSLSKRDVANVEKLIQVIEAVLPCSEEPKPADASCESLTDERQSQPPDKSTNPERAMRTAASFRTAPPLSALAPGTNERRLWSEMGCVVWRITALQKLNLLSYIAEDPLETLRRLFRCMVDAFQALLDSVPKKEKLELLSQLCGDRLLHLLSVMCCKPQCISMLGDQDGTALYHLNCDHLVLQRHLPWMTEMYVCFCDEVHHRQQQAAEACNSSSGIDSEVEAIRLSLVPSAYAEAIEQVLLALRSCCESHACSRELLRSEPTPCVSALLYGMRLRISIGRSLSLLESEELEEGGVSEANSSPTTKADRLLDDSPAAETNVTGTGLTRSSAVSEATRKVCFPFLHLSHRRKQRHSTSRYFSSATWRVRTSEVCAARHLEGPRGDEDTFLRTGTSNNQNNAGGGAEYSGSPSAKCRPGAISLPLPHHNTTSPSILQLLLERCRSSVYAHFLSLALDVVVEAVRVQQTFDHWTLLPTLSSFSLLSSKFLSEDPLTHRDVYVASHTLSMWSAKRLCQRVSTRMRSAEGGGTECCSPDSDVVEEGEKRLDEVMLTCDRAVAMHENMVLVLQMLRALASSIRPVATAPPSMKVAPLAEAKETVNHSSPTRSSERLNPFYLFRSAASASAPVKATPSVPETGTELTPKPSLAYLRDVFFTEILRSGLSQHLQQVLRTPHPILAADPLSGLMCTLREFCTLNQPSNIKNIMPLALTESQRCALLSPSTSHHSDGTTSRQGPRNTSIRFDSTSRAVAELKGSFAFSSGVGSTPATNQVTLLRPLGPQHSDRINTETTASVDDTLPGSLQDRQISSSNAAATIGLTEDAVWLDTPSYVHIVEMVVDLLLEVSGNKDPDTLTVSPNQDVEVEPFSAGEHPAYSRAIPTTASGMAVLNGHLSITLSALLELSEITLVNEAVFEAFSGRLTNAAILRTLLHELERVLGSSRSQSVSSAGVPDAIPVSTTELCRYKKECGVRSQLLCTLAVLCCAALERLYYDNEVVPIAAETKRIIELPLFFGVLRKNEGPAAGDEPSSTPFDGMLQWMGLLFTRLVDLWRISLDASCEEDTYRRSMKVFLMLCQLFHEQQWMPQDTPGFLHRTKARVPSSMATGASFQMSLQFATGSSLPGNCEIDSLGGTVGDGRPSSSSFSSRPFDGPITSLAKPAITTNEIDCVQESGSTTDILKAIFLTLLEHDPLLFNKDIGSVLLQLLRSSNLNLSRLGRLCVRASLLWRESHQVYAHSLRQPSTGNRIISQLLHLLSRHLTADDVTDDTIFERRISLLHGGVVEATIEVLTRNIADTVVLNDENQRSAITAEEVEAIDEKYIQQVPVIFRFLAAFEPSQHRSPHLVETDFVTRTSEQLALMTGVERHWLIVKCAIYAALGGTVSVPHSGTTSSPGRVRRSVSTPTEAGEKGRWKSIEEQQKQLMERHRIELVKGSCVADKTIFLDLIPPCANYLKVHCSELYQHLIDDVLFPLFRATGSIGSRCLVDFVLQNTLTQLLPSLALPNAIVNTLPFKGPPSFLQSYWLPALLHAPMRSHIRFVEQGGVCVNLAVLPPRGLTISTVIRFDAIYPVMPLMELRAMGKTETSFSIVVTDGDTMQLVHENDRSRTTLNDHQGLLHFLPNIWIQLSMVFTITRTVSVFLNGFKVGCASVPYFIPSAGITLNLGFVERAIPNSAFAISEVTVWAEELTWRQVEAAMAGIDRAAAEDAKVHLREVAVIEDLRNHNEADKADGGAVVVVNPIDDRVAHFMAHENDCELLVNVCTTNAPHPTMAKIVGRHATPPKCWVDFRLLWVSKGGLMLMLEWFKDITSSAQLLQIMTVFSQCVRHVCTLLTMDNRIYLLFAQQIRHCGSYFNQAVAEQLLSAAATPPVAVHGLPQSSTLVNRLLLLHVLCDPQLYLSLPVDISVFLFQRMEGWFDPTVCAFAKRNVHFADPVVFVDRLLQAVVQMGTMGSLRVLCAAVKCAKQVLIVCYDQPAVLDIFTTLAAVLTPVEVHHTPSLLNNPGGRIRLSRCSSACAVKLPLRVLRHISYLLLATLIECRLPTGFRRALAPCLSLEWYVTCLSSFTLPASVLCATRLFLDAAPHSPKMQKDIEAHQLTIVEALRPHAWCEDVPLLLLAISIGAHKRIELLSGRLPLLGQMSRHRHWNTTPDVIGETVASISMKVLVYYLQSIIDAEGVLPNLGHYASLMNANHWEKDEAEGMFSFSTVPATAATAVSHYMQAPKISFRFRRIVSAVRTCACLMLVLQKKRYQNSGMRAASPAPAAVADDQDRLYPVKSKHLKAWAALRVAVRLWIPIQRERYAAPPTSTRSRHKDDSRASSIATKQKDRAASDTVLQLVVRCFYRITSQPQFHNLFSAAPLQAAALSSLFGLISVERMETVASRFEEKMLALASGSPSTAPQEVETSPMHSFASPPSPCSPVMSSSFHEDSAGATSQFTSPLPPRELSGMPLLPRGGISPLINLIQGPDITQASFGSLPATSQLPPAERPSGEGDIISGSFEEPVEGHGSFSASMFVELSPRATLPEKGRNTSLTMVLSGATIAPEGDGDGQTSVSSDRNDLSPSFIHDRSFIVFGSWKKTRKAMGEQTRREAIRILSTLIEISLCVEPPSTIHPITAGGHRSSTAAAAAVEWVGGKRYGSGGGLLLQMLFITSATAPDAKASGNLIRYFIFKVASYIHHVFLPQTEVDTAARLTPASPRPPMAGSRTTHFQDTTSVPLSGAPLEATAPGTGSDSGVVTTLSEPRQNMSTFLTNISKLTSLVSIMISVNVVSLTQVRGLFLTLIASSAHWPVRERVEEVHRTVILSCISSIRKPFEMTDGLEKLETVLALSRFTLACGYVGNHIVECFFAAVQQLYESPSATWVTKEVCEKRNLLITKIYRVLLKVYVASTAEAAATGQSKQLFNLRHRSTHKNPLLDALSRIFDQYDDDQEACKKLELFYHENTSLIENFKSGKVKSNTENFIKEENNARKDYVQNIKQFSLQYAQAVSEKQSLPLHELRNQYYRRFSSYIDTPPSALRNDGGLWLTLSFAAAGFQLNQRPDSYHCLDAYSGYCGMEAAPVSLGGVACASPTGVATSRREKYEDNDEVEQFAAPFSPPTATEADKEDVLRIFLHDTHLSHVQILVPCLSTRCRPWILLRPPSASTSCGCSTPHFIHPSLSFLTPAAWTLVRYILHPKDQLRHIGNCFHVCGLSATPCLFLLTRTQVLLLSFSRLTEEGDIVLFEREERYQFSRSSNSSVSDFQATRRSSHSSASAVAATSSDSTTNKNSFSLAAVTRHIHRFLVEDTGKDKQKRQEQLHRDGTKVAQAVRQSTRHTYRQLCWSYLVSTIRKVSCVRYMHMETAVHLKIHLGDGPMLALMDQHESMNPSARFEFVTALKDVLREHHQLEEVEFFEESQRPAKLRSMLIRWATGSICNLEYLRFLNAVAGRTQKDFNQYPVFPWVLADYSSAVLNFNKDGTFRVLSHPIGAQTESSRAQLMQHYENSREMTLNEDGTSYPFHHGTHYSTSGGLLYFLLRAEPFTTFARLYQGGSFDRPGRLFASVAETYRSCISVSTDSKELIPAFYEDAGFLRNIDELDLGVREGGVRVNDVELPPWAKDSPQVFAAVMRYALESDYVLNHLHEWIDLVFGIRRRGPLAVERFNVFQRMTYGEAVVEALNQANSKQDCDVIIAEVENFGQVPRQLFTERHPSHKELAPTPPTTAAGGGEQPSSGGKLTYKQVFDREAPHILQMLIHSLSDEPSAHSVMVEAGLGWNSVVRRVPELLARDFGQSTAITSFAALNRSTLGVTDSGALLPRAATAMGNGVAGASISNSGLGGGDNLGGLSSLSGNSLQAVGEKIFFPTFLGCTAVEGTNYYICWHKPESCLMRFCAATGFFLSMMPFYLPDESGVRITSLCATYRESIVLIGTSAGSLYALFPDAHGRAPYLHTVLQVHQHPIVAIYADSTHGRAVTLTDHPDDDPALWRIAHCHTSLLARLPVKATLQAVQPHEGQEADQRVRHACIDARHHHVVLITRQYVLVFDGCGRLYGQGTRPCHGSARAGVTPRRVSPPPTTTVAPMTVVALYETSEWANGMQLLVVGHADGTLSLWRVTRCPPAALKEGAIVMVQYHAAVQEQPLTLHCQGGEEARSNSSRDSSSTDVDEEERLELRRRLQREQEQISHRGAVTALRQVKAGVPHFLIGYESQLIRSWRFGTRPDVLIA